MHLLHMSSYLQPVQELWKGATVHDELCLHVH